MRRSFFDAWQFLEEHSLFFDEHGFSHFQQLLDINVTKVNPLTGENEEDESLNTEIAVWLEANSYIEQEDKEGPYTAVHHHTELDTGGKTFEEAIINLAALVEKIYGTGEKTEH